MEDGPHKQLLDAAIAREADAQRALLERGDATGFAEAAELYRASWEAAPPRSFGRLVGMLKAMVLSGAEDLGEAAAYARDQVGEADSPPSWYVLAIAALISGDDDGARAAAAGMGEGSEAFQRAAWAVVALADGDGDAYAAAVRAIVDDFEHRDAHLTGVPIADTAAMFERLAALRGMAARVRSPLLPVA